MELKNDTVATRYDVLGVAIHKEFKRMVYKFTIVSMRGLDFSISEKLHIRTQITFFWSFPRSITIIWNHASNYISELLFFGSFN